MQQDDIGRQKAGVTHEGVLAEERVHREVQDTVDLSLSTTLGVTAEWGAENSTSVLMSHENQASKFYCG